MYIFTGRPFTRPVSGAETNFPSCDAPQHFCCSQFPGKGRGSACSAADWLPSKLPSSQQLSGNFQFKVESASGLSCQLDRALAYHHRTIGQMTAELSPSSSLYFRPIPYWDPFWYWPLREVIIHSLYKYLLHTCSVQHIIHILPALMELII